MMEAGETTVDLGREENYLFGLGFGKIIYLALGVTLAVFYLFEGRSLRLYPKNTFKYCLILNRL